MRVTLATAAALLVLAFAPLPLMASATSEPDCREEQETTAPMTPLADGYYLSSPVDSRNRVTPSWAAVWHEENGLPGIQGSTSHCHQVVDGKLTSWTVPPDRRVAGGPDMPELPWGCTLQPLRCSIPV